MPADRMQAAVLEAFDTPLRFRDVATAVPAGDELLVRVRAVGLCATDLKIIRGALPGVSLPLIPGHEVAGEVAEAAHGFAAGQRVVVYPLESCGSCRPCVRGDTETCLRAIRIGFERDGGLAQYLSVKPAYAIAFDERVPFEHAAVAMDAVLAPWRALHHRAHVRCGDTVLIVGAGGLGLHGVQVAVVAGCHVAVVEPLASHRERALALGAELAVAPNEAASSLAGWASEGVDVAFESSGVPKAFRLGADTLRPGGVIVCVGYQPGADYAFDSSRLALAQIRIEGSRTGNVAHGCEVLAAIEAGEIAPVIDHVAPFEQVNELLAELAAGEVVGRVVAQMAA